jgi:hypothetical protein
MPKLEYFLICESMSTDQETNRVSLFHVLEDLQVLPPGTTPQQQLVVPQFVAVSCWNREPGDEDKEFQAILRIHPPDDEPRDFSMNFQMTRPRYRLSLRFQGMPKLEPGVLKFELLLNAQHVASHTVNVFPAKATSLTDQGTLSTDT